jgi:hypothetical protein
MLEPTIERLREQVTRAADDYWFVQFVEEIERTQITFTFRLYTIRKGVFVQVFWGARSKTLSLVLIESDQRIFGVDFHRGRWHMHPFGAPNDHVFLSTGMGDNPVERFMAMVEAVLVENDLL